MLNQSLVVSLLLSLRSQASLRASGAGLYRPGGGAPGTGSPNRSRSPSPLRRRRAGAPVSADDLRALVKEMRASMRGEEEGGDENNAGVGGRGHGGGRWGDDTAGGEMLARRSPFVTASASGGFKPRGSTDPAMAAAAFALEAAAAALESNNRPGSSGGFGGAGMPHGRGGGRGAVGLSQTLPPLAEGSWRPQSAAPNGGGGAGASSSVLQRPHTARGGSQEWSGGSRGHAQLPPLGQPQPQQPQQDSLAQGTWDPNAAVLGGGNNAAWASARPVSAGAAAAAAAGRQGLALPIVAGPTTASMGAFPPSRVL